MTGLFIAFEGGEGAGKTTQVDRLTFTLMQAGITPVVTREPGATPLGLQLRRLLLDSPPGTVPARAEALLYAADRAVHAASVIWPALDRGEIVICDRYIDSSVAYQGFGRKLGPGHVAALSEFATDSLFPDLVIVLDIDPQIGLARVASRGVRPDRIESEALEFHQLVRAGFLSARSRGGRYLMLDATEPADVLAGQIATHVFKLIEESGRVRDAEPVAKVIAMKDRSS